MSEVLNRVKPRMDEDAYRLKLEERGMLLTGEMVGDPVPMDAPLGFEKHPSMVEHLRALIRSDQLRREADEAGNESFEEADDFEVADDLYPASAYEVVEEVFEPPIPEPVATAPAAATVAPAAAPVEGAGGAAGAPAPSPGPAVSSST